MKTRNYSFISFYLTLLSILFIFWGNSLFREDNITFGTTAPYILSLLVAIAGLVCSIVGFYRRDKFRYLGLANIIYAGLCLSYFLYLFFS